jgi:hypothetical protein
MEARRDRIGRDRDEEALRGNGHGCDLLLLVTPAIAKGGKGGGGSTTT